MLPTLSTDLSIYFLYFTLQVNLQTKTSQGVLLPHPTTFSTINGSSLYSSTIYQLVGYPKKNGCRSYSSQYGDFPSFCLDKDANKTLLDGLQGRRLPSHAAAAAAPLAPTPTWDRHWYAQQPGCQGLRTGTGHLGGGARQVGSMVTDGENPDRDLPQNQRVHGMRRAAAFPSRADGSQGGVGMGS